MNMFILFCLTDSECETSPMFRGVFNDKALAVEACRKLFKDENLGQYGGSAWVNEMPVNTTESGYAAVFGINCEGKEDFEEFRSGVFC